MQTFGEQMSSAGRAQAQAQIELFGAIARTAVDQAGQLALLQLNAAREALDRSSATWLQLFSLGPDRLADFASRAQSNWSGMLDAARKTVEAATPLSEQAGQQAPTSQGSDQAYSRVEAAGAAPAPAAAAAREPAVRRTAVAEAAALVAPDGHAGHPAASPLVRAAGEVELPRVKPLEAAAPLPPLAPAPNRRKGAPRK